ncbi:MAG: DUF2135 domain-containing protein [Kiritimatiellaeota bacterium]|nr:DUF2135 domain-containing protein [Kiritimatiellota bacterium]
MTTTSGGNLSIRDENGDVWFTLSDLPDAAKETQPRQSALISIAWDASRSRATANLERELDFLEHLIKEIGATRFALVPFSDTLGEVQFFISFDALKTAINNLVYDGGTDMNALIEKMSQKGPGWSLGNLPPPPSLRDAPWFVFTDGLDTLNESLAISLQPFSFAAVVSQSTADREALRQMCGGSLIDLQRLETDAAVALALNPPRRVTGVEGSGIADVQGIGAVVSGRVMLTGRLTAETAKLRVAYSDGTFSDYVTLKGDERDAGDQRSATAPLSPTSPLSPSSPDRHAPRSLLATVWAAGRVTRLSTNAAANEDELLDLGRRFSLVSPATSLIVLETLDQYLRHEIEPPAQLADMRAQWRQRMADRPKTAAADKLESVVRMWQARVAWWEGKGETPKPMTVASELISLFGRNASAGAAAAPMPPMMARGIFDIVEENAVEALALYASVEGDMQDFEWDGDEMFDMPVAAAARGMSEQRADRAAAPAASRVQITAWNPDVPYLKRLKAAAPAEREAVYLEEAKNFGASPAFFLDCADFFLGLPVDEMDTVDEMDKAILRPPASTPSTSSTHHRLGLRILSNLAELRIEDPALLRVYAWRLQQAGDLDRAVTLLRRVTRLRPEDPQSWRDLALALAERGKAGYNENGGRASPLAAADLAEAQELLKKVVLTPWNRTREIELFALEELNALMDWIERHDGVAIDLDPRLRKNLDLDLRVAMSWDADATDIDLHVIEPSGEEAFYGHNLTSIRGLVTADITDGYGPEAYLLRSAPAGIYTVKADYYGSSQQTVLGPATVTARVFTNWGRENESSQTLTLRLESTKERVEIGKIKIGDVPLWQPADLATMKLRAGMTEDEISTLLGKPARVEDGAWFYTSANRNFKFVFEEGKLLRAVEFLPGMAEMIITQ